MSYDDIAAESQRQHSRFQEARRQATREHCDDCPACQDAMAYEAASRKAANEAGELPELFEVAPFMSAQCYAWIHGGLRTMLHTGTRGVSRGEVEAA